MFKNVAAKFIVFAFDATTNVPKTGDAANITAYVSKDYGAVTVLGDTSATEMDATNAPGYYLFDAAQAETNADCLMISAKSSTSNIKVIGAPAVIYTRPTTGWLAPTTAGRTLDVTATGGAGIDWSNVEAPTTALALTGTTIAVTQKVDVDTIKTNPVVNGGTITFPTTATLASTTNITAATGVDITKILGTAISTPATAGILDVNVKNMNNVAGTAITTVKAVQGLTTADTVVTVSGNVNGSVGSVTGAVGSVTGAVGSVTGAVGSVTGNVGGNVVGSVASVTAISAGAITAASLAADTITAAKVASDVTDEIWAKACTEPTSVVSATPTAIAAMSWLLTLSRNKITQTATTQILKADDGSTTIASSTVSNDGTTFTRGEFA